MESRNRVFFCTFWVINYFKIWFIGITVISDIKLYSKNTDLIYHSYYLLDGSKESFQLPSGKGLILSAI